MPTPTTTPTTHATHATPSIKSQLLLLAIILTTLTATAHEPTWPAYQHDLAIEVATAQKQQADTDQLVERAGRCQITLTLVDHNQPQNHRPGMIRITTAAGQPLYITDLPNRAAGIRNADQARRWHILNRSETFTVPQTKIIIHAIAGLKTQTARLELDLTNKPQATATLAIKDFYNPAAHNLVSANTHLHLRNMTLDEADTYLTTYPAADNLDLTFVSHLERHKVTPTYISNQYTPASLAALTTPASGLLAYGQEHRHNFGPGDEGFGHVMFLDLQKLIQPVSIGPGIANRPSDAPPLQHGILAARQQNATILWCHNTLGYEDIPNWVAGLIHAQNIFDGGTTGGYAESFYRYLNLGLRVPFSTGTDWFLYDFSRVYAQLDEPLTSDSWLDALKRGRTYITNGPFLEFTVDNHHPGDTLNIDKPRQLSINARALGRADFQTIQLIHNGNVIATAKSNPAADHFQSTLTTTVNVTQPGWLALRIQSDNQNALGRPLFAHTSPVYINVNNQRPFDRDVAQNLIDEMRQSIIQIKQQGAFADNAELESVIAVYRKGIATLEARRTK